MATGLLMLLDDIAATADDIATMSKLAFKKTSGILGDDLALNAEQVSGMSSNRELPVVLKVFKGSLINKLILVPLALLISYFTPWLMTPLLMIGGAYLCYEGVENIYEKFHKKEHGTSSPESKFDDPNFNLAEYEDKKVKGAVRTDFVLSAEIIVVSLNSLGDTVFLNKVIALSLLAVFFTFFVYGLVALIVRLDDIGFWFKEKKNIIFQKFGELMINIVPYIMKGLSTVGLIAMFLVGGGIVVHGLPFMHGVENVIYSAFSQSLSGVIGGTVLSSTSGFTLALISGVISTVAALVVGSILVAIHGAYTSLVKK